MDEMDNTHSNNPLFNPDVRIEDLSSEDFAAMFEQALEQNAINAGSVLSGRIVAIEADYAIVDIGYKSEGRIPLGEFRASSSAGELHVGDQVDVYLDAIEDEDGQLVLSKEKADLMKAWDDISRVVDEDGVIEGTITARVKGGLSVDIGVKAFLPGSQVDLRPVKNLDKLIGTSAAFKVIKFNKKRGNIVLSRRVLLEQEREKRRKETLKKLEVGAIMRGVVKNITDYGAFIDLGGIDGLLHITDMSYGRINHPSELFQQGDEVDVMILKFDADTQRVSLGFKQIKPDPWTDAQFKYPPGTRINGRVVSLTDYGAFVELEEGIEGLVHISEMTWNKRIKHPSKLVTVGDKVDAVVLDIDTENKRVSLGMKQLETNPWDLIEEKYPVGAIIEGKIRNITDFGIFIGVEEGIDGLVHISDLTWGQRLKHPSEKYKKGQTVQAKVLNIDKANERFSLGIKQLTSDPWRNITSRFFLGQVVEGVVAQVVEYGVYVELEEGVEGLVELSELRTERSGDMNEDYKANESKVTAEIVTIDPHDRKITLSERTAGTATGTRREAAAAQDSRATLRDVMQGLLARDDQGGEEGGTDEEA